MQAELGTAVLIAIVAFMAYQGFKSSESKLPMNQLDKQPKEAEELLLVKEASSLLPDGNAAIRNLLQSFTWQQIFECYGLGTLEMELLRALESGGDVTLPSPKAKYLEEADRYVIREARQAAKSVQEEFDLDSWYQRPTTITLENLTTCGLVVTSPSVDPEERNYTVHFTPRGIMLTKLDETFRNRAFRFDIPTRFFSSAKARSEVGGLLRTVVESNDNLTLPTGA